ncbi:ABC-2 type transport system permease protein [Amycolatopsis xylanica]|uniref:ABC-2 type transport system permease protein n=1 Tax=Amycolatopsis xylanica TaxID=589385 RepID=A0A1H3SXD1_9PSEU|nr:ABC transporter permease [Amycolatopsis xylanica]SDZ42642.1 ABC-2 type transport system permease protein [Amycolatopsis xylanica]
MTDKDVRLSPAAAVRLVASREIGTRLRSKAYRISTLAMLVLIVGGVFVAKLIGSSGGTTVGVVGPTAPLAAPLQASAQAIGEKLETSQVPDEAAGRAKVADGSLDALIVGDATKLRVVVKKDLDGKLKNALNVLAGQLALKQEIEAQGGDAAKVQAAVANASVEVLPMEKPFDYSGEQLVLGYIAGLLIYISLMINGQIVAQGVVEEKTSRVVELLLATIRPWQLMAGKVLGIGVVGLIQMVLIGGLGIGAALGAGVLTLSVSAALGIVIWLIVWFLLGFFMYAIVFAGLGALVSRQEDVGGAVAPALTFVIAGYIVGATVLPSNPGSGFVEVLSMIPVFSPTLMPMRLAMGGVPVWEAALSVVLVVATIPLLIWFAGRMYSGAVMRTGAKVKLREALKAP